MMSARPTIDLDGAEFLGRLFAAAYYRRPLDSLAAECLCKGILKAARTGLGLDAALGISGAGKRSVRQKLLMIRRDLHLVEALRAVTLDEAATDWQRSQRLAPPLRRFMTEAWPRASQLDAPPNDWPTWKIEVFRAAQTGLRLPRSEIGLYEVLRRTPHYLAKNAGAILLSRYL
jgi:hypothetical protein